MVFRVQKLGKFKHKTRHKTIFLNVFIFFAFAALSQMASRSITEDKYGVVQTILPSLIRTLLDLYEVNSFAAKFSAHFLFSSYYMYYKLG